MTDLIVCMTDKVGLSHIKGLIEKNEWDNIFLITTEQMANVDIGGETNLILVDLKTSTESLTGQISRGLNGNVSGLEVALNLFSGSGKEHMAIIAAILKLGLGIRLVKQGKEKIKEI